jgi:hypothetical protein
MNKKGFVFLETIIILVLVTTALTTMLTSYTVITSKSREKEYYDRISDKYLLYSLSNLGVTGIGNETSATSYNYRVLASKLKKDNADNCATKHSSNEVLYKECLSEKIGVLKIDVKNKDCSNFCSQTQSYQKDAKNIFCNIFANYEGITSIHTSSFDKDLTESGNCTHVFEEMRLYRIYFVDDVAFALNSEYATEFFSGDNGAIEYLKTLRKCDNENAYVQYIKDDGTSCSGDTEPGCHRVVLNELVTDNTICATPVKYMIGVFQRNHDFYYASIEI